MRRVLAIGLDGFDLRVADGLMRRGVLPNFVALRDRSACYLLDRPSPVRPALTWEYLASGLTPEAADKWTSVQFDPATYGIWQQGATLVPFADRLAARTVVFDAPFFDLARAPTVRGVVGWGAHNPGVAQTARPHGLLGEMNDRFGPNKAGLFLYGITWPSVDATVLMAQTLTQSILLRGKVAAWLLAERLPDWDLAIVVTGELHPATEGMWHGIDSAHLLHGKVASTRVAAQGLALMYRAVDQMIGELVARFPDAAVLLFSPEGMGPNESDAASMVLLPELLYRHAFAEPYMTATSQPGTRAELPPLTPEAGWVHYVNSILPVPPDFERTVSDPVSGRQSLDWMPTVNYRPFWPRMPAFALPTFDEGRIRLNLVGREANGIVPVESYESVRDELTALLSACSDPLTGRRVVLEVVRPRFADPRRIGDTRSDLTILWNGAVAGFDHPRHGRMGPLPFRRTGGHSGGYGIAWIANAGMSPGHRGTRQYCDLAPTIVGLLGEAVPSGMAGRDLLQA